MKIRIVSWKDIEAPRGAQYFASALDFGIAARNYASSEAAVATVLYEVRQRIFDAFEQEFEFYQ